MAESAHNVVPDGGKKRDEDSEDGLDYSPFWGIEKGAVLQEARCFNESQLDARRCQQVITKLLYLCNQGDTFTKVIKQQFQSNTLRLAHMCCEIISNSTP